MDNHQITKWAKILFRSFRRTRYCFQLGRLGRVIGHKCECYQQGDGKAKGAGKSRPFAAGWAPPEVVWPPIDLRVLPRSKNLASSSIRYTSLLIIQRTPVYSRFWEGLQKGSRFSQMHDKSQKKVLQTILWLWWCLGAGMGYPGSSRRCENPWSGKEDTEDGRR